jgi:hypothetical protein
MMIRDSQQARSSDGEIAHPLPQRLRLGVLGGLAMGGGFTLLAVPFALVRLASGSVEVADVLVLFMRITTLYLAGGAAGGALVGICWPLRHWWLGRRILGFLAALPLMFGVRLLFWGPGNWQSDLSFYDARIWLATAAIYGSVMSFVVERRRYY